MISVKRQLLLLSVLVPFWLILIMDGVRGVRETWPAILVAGGSFAVVQYVTANHIGPELPDIIDEAPARQLRAFSSEVATGSREENATKQGPRAFLRFNET